MEAGSAGSNDGGNLGGRMLHFKRKRLEDGKIQRWSLEAKQTKNGD